MEITIGIDGKQVAFKSLGSAVPRYMAQFQRDLIKDILSLGIVDFDFAAADELTKLKWARENINFAMFYDIAWVYAKLANPSIPDPWTWLDTFEEFPIFDILEPLQELMAKTISSKKKETAAPPQITKPHKK